MFNRAILAGTMLIAACVLEASNLGRPAQRVDERVANRVYASFDLSQPEGGPFPADIFTVADATQNTGRRVNYPLPDCAVRINDCDDLAEVNSLDGWGLQPRISIPFGGDVDPATVNSNSVFLITMSGERVGINQLIWDPGSHTLFAESDVVLDQQRRYAVIVTDAVRDLNGKAVKATSDFKETIDFDVPDAGSVPPWYRERLAEVVHAALAAGIPRRAIVSASAFHDPDRHVGPRAHPRLDPGRHACARGFQSRTERRTLGVPEDRGRERGSTAADHSEPAHIHVLVSQPRPARCRRGRGWHESRTDATTRPSTMVHPGEFIPAVGTTDTPPVRAITAIYFTLYLPAGAKPPGGWPIAIMSGGASTHKHLSSTGFAAELAAHGIAVVGINHVGQGSGPLTKLKITRTNATSLEIPDAGRGVDQDGDNNIGMTEGSKAAYPRTWTIAERDAQRQTLIDFLQLVRVIEVGMDVDGDGAVDIDPSRIYFVGASSGSMIGTLFLALERDVRAGVAAFTPGVIPEHLRWQIVRRPEIGTALQNRTPSLLNNANGLTSIDGVTVAGPYFNENKPLRDQPLVINDVPGALEIQQALEFSEMVSESGLSPALWSRYLREAPLAGSYAKSVVYMFAQGDRTAVNPGTSLLLRSGNLTDRTIYFRTDLAVALDKDFPKEPHGFLLSTLSGNLLTSHQSPGAGRTRSVRSLSPTGRS